MNKTKITLALLFAIVIPIAIGMSFACNSVSTQNGNDPWTDKQLMQPADLAKSINDPASAKPILFGIGFGGGIKGAIDLGPAKEKENVEKLRAELNKLPKDANIVIYCGCCPFKNCPNIRPAFNLLNEMKFTNHKLLNLSENLKTDWIDKGYPVSDAAK
ncbi:MAG: rhodanese-like domain-containing protein [Bacteroidetes bacterium]|nr:rhodanese-like domain-containing protein [Bacteroidota bacterium]